MMSHSNRPFNFGLHCLTLFLLSLQTVALLDGGRRVERGGLPEEGVVKVVRNLEEEDNNFKEELRTAMNSQWEILQNIRYHTLISKMKVSQLDAKVKKLSKKLQNIDNGGSIVTSSEELCHEDYIGDGREAEDEEEEEEVEKEQGEEAELKIHLKERENELTSLLQFLRKVSKIFQSFNDTAMTLKRPIEFEGGLEKVLEELNPLTLDSRFPTEQQEEGRKLTKKSTRDLNATMLTTVATITASTTSFPEDIEPYFKDIHSNIITAFRGTTASLKCQVTNQGAYTVVWTQVNQYGGLDILTAGQYVYSSDNRHDIVYDAESRDWILTIKNVTPKDEGMYKCEVNSNPPVSSNVHLTVIKPVTEKNLMFSEKNITVEEGKEALLSCHVHHLGDASVSWLRSSDLHVLTAGEFTLSLDRRFKALTDPHENMWKLHITEVRLEDEGEYVCQVSTHPLTTHTFWLTVYAKDYPASSQTDLSSPSTTVLTHCFHPFEVISGGLCILHVSQQKMNWMDASQYCKSEGGELATNIDSFLQSFLEQQHGPKGDNWTNWPFWVGANEERGQNGETIWKWVGGTPVDSKTWAYNQPRKYGRRATPKGSCMVLDGYQGYAAAALPCHYRRRFVCLQH